ncbi:MAG TPA: DUF4783 domain-containing protein [Bacteroidia bacterium]|nr:DUF4783 domain-containing protein [Bacteroidia bacterium]
MKNLHYYIVCFFAWSLTSFTEFDVYDEVSNAIRSGDSNQLAAFFGTTVDLTILSKEEVYSKTQAELVLRDFFSKYTPKTFSILHKGSSKEGTLYAIGNMTTAKGTVFRTSFFLRKSGDKYLIQELRFETE